MHQLEVIEDRACRNDVLEKSTQRGDVPLAVAELVDQAVLGFGRRNPERVIKCAIARLHAQRRIENQQWLTNRVDDVLRIRFDRAQIGFGPASLRHVLHRKHDDRRVTSRAQLATVQQHYTAPDLRERVLELEVIEDRAGRNDVLEKSPQVRNVPLTIAKLVDQLVFGFDEPRPGTSRRRRGSRFVLEGWCPASTAAHVRYRQYPARTFRCPRQTAADSFTAPCD